MALDDRFSDVHELPAVVLGVTPEHLERLVCIDRMAGHEDPLRLLDRRAAAESPLQGLVFGEALERDLDRTLQLLGVAVDDVGEDPAFRRFADIRGILAESRAITGQEASRTISVIRSSECSECSPSPTSATSGRSLRVTAPTSATWISRAITS